eukprot:3415513-Rhodomonas_salina.2
MSAGVGGHGRGCACACAPALVQSLSLAGTKRPSGTIHLASTKPHTQYLAVLVARLDVGHVRRELDQAP